MRTAILAAVLLAGCAATKKEPPPKPFTGTVWQVVLELPLHGEPPAFRFGDGRMEGFAGCNRVSAPIVQDSVGARAIAFRRIDRGTRICDAASQAAENRVLDVFQGATSYTITGDEMVMSGSNGSLKFRALTELK